MGYPIYFDANKSQKELGLEYRDVKESLVEHFQQLLDDGVIKQYIPWNKQPKFDLNIPPAHWKAMILAESYQVLTPFHH